jgi:transposase
MAHYQGIGLSLIRLFFTNLKVTKMNRTFKHIVGIDVSKKHLDAALIIGEAFESPMHFRFTNDENGFKNFTLWLLAQQVILDSSLLLVIEHTGLYQSLVVSFCSTNKISLCTEQANQIRWSLGLQRGKSDKLDSRRIALYGYKSRDTIASQGIPPVQMGKLQRLLALRERFVNARKQIVTTLEEMTGFIDQKEIAAMKKIQEPVVKKLEASIIKTEEAIKLLVKEDPAIHKNFKLLLSIKGIGMVTAWHLIVYTCNFTRYEKGKQLACYCGVVPFSHQSGSSIKGKSRVSHMANKSLKVLLHMAAVSAIQHDPELKQYYLRKTATGKHAMCVINAVRNKLVLRIARVVERQSPFVDNYSKNAA